jgi:hypothetical protein
LKTGRNDPCPCGSGKKYKRCCGVTTTVGRQEPRVTKIHNIPALAGCVLLATVYHSLSEAEDKPPAVERSLAYGGEIGKRRETFCLEYVKSKKARIAGIEQELREKVARSGKVISCSEGCVHCCKYPVDASLQECEGIVYHLYQHDDLLRHFLKAFGVWKERIMRIETCFSELQTFSEKIMSDRATEQETEYFYERCGEYGVADIPCPFLIEGSCSIYEVRPFVCAGVVATTPREWCNSSHPRLEDVQNVKVSFQLETDMPYFASPEGSYYYSSMPFLVYRLLEEGYGALASVPGLEKLKE